MLPLTEADKKSYRKQTFCHICKKEFSNNGYRKKYFKLWEQCHYTGKYSGAVHNLKCNLRYKKPKEIPLLFLNGCNYDYYFLIKELAEEIKGKFECSREIR